MSVIIQAQVCKDPEICECHCVIVARAPYATRNDTKDTKSTVVPDMLWHRRAQSPFEKHSCEAGIWEDDETAVLTLT